MSYSEKLSMMETKSGYTFKVGEKSNGGAVGGKVVKIFHCGLWFEVFFDANRSPEVYHNEEVKSYSVAFDETLRHDYMMEMFEDEYRIACAIHPEVGNKLFAKLSKRDVSYGLRVTRKKILDEGKKGNAYASDALLCEFIEANEAYLKRGKNRKRSLFVELLHVAVVAFRMAEMAERMA